MENIALVVLDIGGTIIEDRGEVPSALTSAFALHDIDIAKEAIRSFRGGSKRKAIESLVIRKFGPPPDPAMVDGICGDFQRLLEEQYVTGDAGPVEGAAAVMTWLRGRDVCVAVTTGFSRRTTEVVLSRSGLARLVDAVVTDDDVPMGRPAPYMIFRSMELTGVADVHSVANVGDTPLDLKAGYNAGVSTVVGVATGAYSIDELQLYPEAHVISSVAQLPEILASRIVAPVAL